MTTETPKQRISLAAFDDAGSIVRAVRELDNAEFAPRQVGVAARASSVETLRRMASEEPGYGRLLLMLFDKMVPADSRDDDVLLSPGPFWADLDCFGHAASGVVIAASWLQPHFGDELARHIRRGAVVMGVRAKSLEQQSQGTRILLEFSSSRVQTHEFRSKFDRPE